MDSTQIANDIDQLTVFNSYITSPEQCNTYLTNVTDSLKIIHLNIRSLDNTTNFNNLLILLKRISINIDVIVLSECWLSKCPFIPVIPEFVSHSTDFKNQNDGVVIYIRHYIAHTIEKPVFVDAV